MNTYEQIVRELAASDPHVDIAYWHRNEIECAHCGEPKGKEHAADCPWLRANQAVENADNPKVKITITGWKQPEPVIVPVPYPGPSGGMRA
jgi:hypothetical protein